MSLGVLVSGGAPTLHLGAGALCAFHDQGVSFDVVATSGAGALPGLLYVAPQGGAPGPALRGVVDMNIHDAIYHLIPNNYKVFFKYGPFSQIFYQLGKMIPHLEVPPNQRYGSPYQRLVNDWIDFVTAAITPTTLTPRAKSVLTRVQVVNELVDWTALPTSAKGFFLNAFSLDGQELQVFTKETMTPDAFYAALAMPWLYPPTPTTANGTLFTEGASHDPSGIEAVLENQHPDMKKIDALIVLDTFGPDVWTDPESIYEALELAIMDPIVTLSENVAALYGLQEVFFNAKGMKLPKIYRLPFDIPSWERGKTLEWSYSNAIMLWDIGYKAALKLCVDMKKTVGPDILPDTGYRYFTTLQEESREGDFLKLFGKPFNDMPKTVVPPPVAPGS